MTDTDRGHRYPEPLTLIRVAELVDGRLEGDGTVLVEGVAPLDEAGPSHMGFLAIKRYARLLGTCQAGSFLVSADMEALLPAGSPRVVVAEPYPALRSLLAHFYPERAAPAEIHPTAAIGRGVRIGEGVRIEPYAVIEDDVSIGDGSRIGAHCVVGARTTVGARCRLHPHVVVYHESVIGSDVILHAGARVGSDGFGYTLVDGSHRKMPQVGRAVIENGVEIGANATVDRGSLGDTVVGQGVKIDNLVQVAHNVKVGAASLLAALVGIAGSTRIGKGVWMGGRVSATNHLEIGDGARVTFGSTLMRDVAAGETMSGYPARPHREQMHKQAHLGRLPKLLDRVERLEVEVERMSAPGRADSTS